MRGLWAVSSWRLAGCRSSATVCDGTVNAMGSEPATYFGLWSARDIQKVSDLLTQLNVRFDTNEYDATEEVLRDWCAWDATSPNPNAGYDLWIHSDGLTIVDTKIVDMFPERKFSA